MNYYKLGQNTPISITKQTKDRILINQCLNLSASWDHIKKLHLRFTELCNFQLRLHCSQIQ